MKIIKERERFGSHLGLERIQLVCSALSNPQDHLKFIHIAGTNGKGSVATLMAQVLEEAGFDVGLFTSPHLERYNERFRINGTPIDDLQLEELLYKTEDAIKKVEQDYPEYGAVTEFELGTALAFLYFAASEVDVVVLETGLGGRLDATSVVNPELTVITSIGHDHMDRLGTSLAQIAYEKAGIIKQGVPVVTGIQQPEAIRVLKEAAVQKNAPFYSLEQVQWKRLNWNIRGGHLSYPGYDFLEIRLLGAHQLDNAATALLALEVLQDKGWSISEQAIRSGLLKARWSGRMEVVSSEPLVILDGGHNQEGLMALADGLKHISSEIGSDRFTFIFGMLNSKDIRLVDILFPIAERFVFTKAESGRLLPMESERLVRYGKSRGVTAVGYDSPLDAVQDALETAPICVCGSLYLVGTIKRYLRTLGVLSKED